MWLTTSLKSQRISVVVILNLFKKKTTARITWADWIYWVCLTWLFGEFWHFLIYPEHKSKIFFGLLWKQTCSLFFFIPTKREMILINFLKNKKKTSVLWPPWKGYKCWKLSFAWVGIKLTASQAGWNSKLTVKFSFARWEDNWLIVCTSWSQLCVTCALYLFVSWLAGCSLYHWCLTLVCWHCCCVFFCSLSPAGRGHHVPGSARARPWLHLLN